MPMVHCPPSSPHGLILGFGKTGQAAVRFFSNRGVKTIVFDDRDPEAHLENIPWDRIQFVLVSPGIPFEHAALQEARRQNIPIQSDIDVFVQTIRNSFSSQSSPPVVIGVTGTNGKSTTTALIGHLLKGSFPHVFVGGNIGTPVLDLPIQQESDPPIDQEEALFSSKQDAPPLSSFATDGSCEGVQTIYVLELSSFQLASSHALALDRAVWTNLTEDHLDRHGSMDAYIRAKENIFENAKMSFIGIDDAPSRGVFDRLKAQHQEAKSVSIGACGDFHMQPSGDVFSDNQFLFNRFQASSLPGAHNSQNLLLACAVAQSLGAPWAKILDRLKTFSGLPHRLETTGLFQNIEEILFINDSKATNAASTIKALESFPDVPIYLIAGGRAKSDGLAPAIPFMKNVRHVFLIGEAEARFSQELQGAQAPTFSCSHTLSQAVQDATTCALSDKAQKKIILLSPACASFDQFKNFEERGDVFRQTVQELLKRLHERKN